METEARIFNSDGIKAFQRILSEARSGKASSQAGLIDETGLAEISELLLDDKFSSCYQYIFGKRKTF